VVDVLESFRDSVPGHVRQLLRLLASRCDELEERRLHDFMQWQARCGKIEDGLASINIEGRVTALEERMALIEAGERKAGEQDAADALARLRRPQAFGNR
jgi:hypothetical protein